MKTSKRIIRHRVKYRSNEFYKTLTYFLTYYKTTPRTEKCRFTFIFYLLYLLTYYVLYSQNLVIGLWILLSIGI